MSGLRHAVPLVLALSLAAPAAAGDVNAHIDRFQLWNECRPVNLLAEELPEDAAKIGLKDEAIFVAVRSRLRAARLYKEETDLRSSFLIVRINFVGPAFSTSVDYNKMVRDPTSRVTMPARTWHAGVVGTHGRDPGYILSSVSQHVDKFIDEYLRVNEPACSRR